MIVKRKNEYYVVSEKTGKNLGGLTKLWLKLRRGFDKWNSSSARKARVSFLC
jgi:hypothetical protein